MLVVEPRGLRGTHLLGKERGLNRPRFPSQAQRRRGFPNDDVGIVLRTPNDPDTDMHGDPSRLAIGRNRALKATRNPTCHAGRASHAADAFAEEKELVSAESSDVSVLARDRVGGADARLEPLPNFLDDLVPGVMPELRIDRLEAVDLDREQSRRPTMPGAAIQSALDAFNEQKAPRKAGQTVVQRLKGECCLRVALLRDVTHHHDRTERPAIAVEDGCRIDNDTLTAAAGPREDHLLIGHHFPAQRSCQRKIGGRVGLSVDTAMLPRRSRKTTGCTRAVDRCRHGPIHHGERTRQVGDGDHLGHRLANHGFRCGRQCGQIRSLGIERRNRSASQVVCFRFKEDHRESPPVPLTIRRPRSPIALACYRHDLHDRSGLLPWRRQTRSE